MAINYAKVTVDALITNKTDACYNKLAFRYTRTEYSTRSG
jgi:hypothetical protein